LLGAGFWLTVAGAAIATLNAADADIRCIEPDARTGTSTAVVVADLPLAHTTQILPLDQRLALVGREMRQNKPNRCCGIFAEALEIANSALGQL